MPIEGYWYEGKGSKYPVPKAYDKPWKGKRDFMVALRSLETRAKGVHYKGWSTCRICYIRNGSVEFKYKNWRWPIGYFHYIEHHNVQPSRQFHLFVMLEFFKRLPGTQAIKHDIEHLKPTKAVTFGTCKKHQRSIHGHICSNERCRNIWKHCGVKKSNKQAHTCPKCGAYQFKKVLEAV